MKWASRLITNMQWSGPISNREEKEEVAKQISLKVKENDVIGIGSGSTCYLAIQAIGARINEEGIKCTGIPTSAEVALACASAGIPTTTLLQVRPDWSFDGADEVDPSRNLIKGRGGAMFREKILISASSKTFILVDQSKLVSRLGEKFPVPVEVSPEAVHIVEERLSSLGAVEVTLRVAVKKDGPVITENGNFIFDARFSHIEDSLEREIKRITGVIESGLFLSYEPEVLVAGGR
jgi:ribose 5-phosphate isomerase A